MPARPPITLYQKISLGIVVLMVVGLAVAFVYVELSKPNVGAPCKEHYQCRQPDGQCLKIPAYQPEPLDPGADPLMRSVTEMTNEIFDPLSPNKDSMRPAKTLGGYCTQACQSDDDCPKTMRCAEALSFRNSMLGPDWIDGKGQSVQLCMIR